MKQIIYTPENPPTKGVAKKIWSVLEREGLKPQDLHYNPGKPSTDGSGTWACHLDNGPEVWKHDVSSGCIEGEYWCGIVGKTAIYIEGMVAPYSQVLAGFVTHDCPFRYKGGCKYPSMNPNYENIWPEGCPKNCNEGNDEFLLLRSNQYEKWKR